MDATRRSHLRPILGLSRVTGIGCINFRRLVERFGSAEAALARPREELAAAEGIGDERAAAVAAFDDWTGVDRDLDRAEELGLGCLAWGDGDYPTPLAEIHDPPPVLYYKGDLSRVGALAIAVVGTRHPTDYGLEAARFICSPLAEAGVTIVSGMALGIDAAAHRAALQAGGVTAAVLGCGADVVYPRENDALYAEICERGAVVSEFAPGARPEPQNFPRRNRIISGLTQGTLVVEAGDKSGALITAFLAAEQGREVFAVPGNIFSPASDGCRRLLQTGARAVGSALEILEELAPALSPARPAATEPLAAAALAPDDRTVLEQVAGQALDVDEITARVGWDAGRIANALLHLEIAGLIEKLPGNRYRRLY